MGQFHGKPCWYELGTRQGGLAQAGEFYAKVLGWTITDSGMPDFTYHLAKDQDAADMVAGLMENPADQQDIPPHWTTYFSVDDVDQSVADASAAGAQTYVPPTDIPGTGRFAILADPQGAVFGLLQPDMSHMDAATIARVEAGELGAYDPRRPGHGAWHELMTTDPKAALDFYGPLLGWDKSAEIPMGAMGSYQLFARKGTDIGGMQGLGQAPVPNWLAYFGVAAVGAAMDRITKNGGTVIHGPQEVPGGAFIAIARDPQGAHFAVTGPKE